MTTLQGRDLSEPVEQQAALRDREGISTTLVTELEQLAASPAEARPDFVISTRVEGDGMLLLEFHRLQIDQEPPALSVLCKHAAFVAAALDLPRAQSAEIRLREMIDREIPHSEHRAQARSDLRAARDFEQRVLLLGHLHWSASPAAFSGEYSVLVWPTPGEAHFAALLFSGQGAEQRREFARLFVESLSRGGIATVTEEHTEEEAEVGPESSTKPQLREEMLSLVGEVLPARPQTPAKGSRIGPRLEEERRILELEAKLRAEGKIR